MPTALGTTPRNKGAAPLPSAMMPAATAASSHWAPRVQRKGMEGQAAVRSGTGCTNVGRCMPSICACGRHVSGRGALPACPPAPGPGLKTAAGGPTCLPAPWTHTGQHTDVHTRMQWAHAHLRAGYLPLLARARPSPSGTSQNRQPNIILQFVPHSPFDRCGSHRAGWRAGRPAIWLLLVPRHSCMDAPRYKVGAQSSKQAGGGQSKTAWPFRTCLRCTLSSS